MSDLDTIRDRHTPEPTRKPDIEWCNTCKAIWPCDTRVVLDEIDDANKTILAFVESEGHYFTPDSLAAALRATNPPMSPDAFQAEADAAAIIHAAMEAEDE